MSIYLYLPNFQLEKSKCLLESGDGGWGMGKKNTYSLPSSPTTWPVKQNKFLNLFNFSTDCTLDSWWCHIHRCPSFLLSHAISAFHLFALHPSDFCHFLCPDSKRGGISHFLLHAVLFLNAVCEVKRWLWRCHVMRVKEARDREPLKCMSSEWTIWKT